MAGKPLAGVRKTDTPLRIRLTERERKQLDRAATKAKQPTSTWARELLLKQTQ